MKIDKLKNEINGLEKNIVISTGEILECHKRINLQYGSVRDTTVDSVTTDKAIKSIEQERKDISAHRATINRYEASIQRRLSKISFEERLQSSKY